MELYLFLALVVVGFIPFISSFHPIHICGQVEKSIDGYTQLLSKNNRQQQCLKLNAFQKLDDTGKSEFPFALFTAGLKEESLEIVDGILSEFLLVLPPVIVLGTSDSSTTLNNLLLSDNNRMKRDHQIPTKLFKTKVPVILFSGFEHKIIFDIISRYKSVVVNAPSLQLPECAFANVVSPALHKPFEQLIAEITADHFDNKS